MTQEQAQELLATVNGKLEMKRLESVNLLFREIDELKMMEEDAQQYALKCRKELEALQQPKTCEGCKHRSHLDESLTNKTTNGFCIENGFFTRHGFCCNKHEPKDNA